MRRRLLGGVVIACALVAPANAAVTSQPLAMGLSATPGADNSVWVLAYEGDSPLVAHVDQAGMVTQRFAPLPGPAWARLVRDSGGNLWTIQPNEGRVARVDGVT